MQRLLILMAAPLLLGALAGCLSSDGGGAGTNAGVDGDDGTPTGSISASGSVSAGPASGNASVNGTAGPGGASASQNASWEYDNRTGSVSGNQLLVTGPEPKLEAFTVVDATQKLTVNLTADQDGITITLRPPGCEDASCEIKVGTADEANAATTELRDPEAGDWNAVLAVGGGPGPVSSAYELGIGTLSP